MRRITLLGLCLCFIPLVLSYPWADGKEGYDGQMEGDDSALELIQNLQRRRWCAGWGDVCNPNAKIKFARCCEGLRCVCGVLWKEREPCRCRSPSIFGR